MADYWKSQPKKFCDYCKCWIADNKPSIDFHERGKNHKENVAKKISEIKKKSLEKAKEEEKMAKEFAAMEEAATKAYQEDLKRLGVKAESIGHSSVPKKQEEKKEKKEKKKKGKQSTESSSRKRKEWVRGFSSEGYTYYYNTISGESQWEKPEGFQDATPDTKATAVWIEGASEDGQTYYYNVETGVSTWEKPEGFVTPLVKKNKNENLSEETDVNAEDSDDDGKGKAGSDEETEDRPRKPQKFSPYGEWQEVKQKRRNQKARLPVSQETPKTSSQTAKPYGKWKEITEENPPEDVDLELPSADGDGLPAPVLEVPEDAKVIFKEKTVTSLGSEVAEETPVFKKRKFENGKSRNLRQRLNDL